MAPGLHGLLKVLRGVRRLLPSAVRAGHAWVEQATQRGKLPPPPPPTWLALASDALARSPLLGLVLALIVLAAVLCLALLLQTRLHTQKEHTIQQTVERASPCEAAGITTPTTSPARRRPYRSPNPAATPPSPVRVKPPRTVPNSAPASFSRRAESRRELDSASSRLTSPVRERGRALFAQQRRASAEDLSVLAGEPSGASSAHASSGRESSRRASAATTVAASDAPPALLGGRTLHVDGAVAACTRPLVRLRATGDALAWRSLVEAPGGGGCQIELVDVEGQRVLRAELLLPLSVSQSVGALFNLSDLMRSQWSKEHASLQLLEVTRQGPVQDQLVKAQFKLPRAVQAIPGMRKPVHLRVCVENEWPAAGCALVLIASWDPEASAHDSESPTVGRARARMCSCALCRALPRAPLTRASSFPPRSLLAPRGG